MTESEFHKARRMFVLLQDSVIIAPKDDFRSHYEWFSVLTHHPHEWIEMGTRGYVFEATLYAYKGEDFSHRINNNALVAALPCLDPLALHGMIQRISVGAVGSKESQPWPPKLSYLRGDYIDLVTDIRGKHAASQ